MTINAPDAHRFTLADYYDRSAFASVVEPDAEIDGYPQAGPSRLAQPQPPPRAQAPAASLARPLPTIPRAELALVSAAPPALVRAGSAYSGRSASPEPPIPLAVLEPRPSPTPTPADKFDDDEKSVRFTTPEPFVPRAPPRRASLLRKLLLLVVMLETVIDIAIEANILWRFRQEVTSDDADDLVLQNRRRLPVYLCVFGLAHLWQLVLTIDAIRTKNTIQIIGLAIFNGMFLVYAGIETSEIRSILGSSTPATADSGNSLLTLPLNVLTAVIIGVIAACEVAIVLLTYFVFRDFGWKIYRYLGADLAIRRYYFQYQIFDCICRFSAFFFAGFGVQCAQPDVPVLNKTDPEYVITWIMLPLSLVWLVMGIVAALYENRIGMGIFSTGLVAGCAYFTFKLVRIWQGASTTYAHVSASLTVFSALSIVCLVLCFAAGLVVWGNFGRGLKQHVVGRPGDLIVGRTDHEAQPRISID